MHDLRQTRLGILGGGQLARMLAQAAQSFGLNTHILTPHAEDPAAQVCPQVHLGQIRSPQALREFFNETTHAIFENEFIPKTILEEAARGTGVRFVPALDALDFLQNKLNQKSLLDRLKIPAASHIPLFGIQTEIQLEQHLRSLGGRGVLKWAQLGYDGKGTFFVDARNPEALRQATLFLRDAEMKGINAYLEERIPFKKELAIIAVHSVNGEFKAYPLVVSEQEQGICRRVYGPAKAAGIPARLEKEAAAWAQTIARALPLHGVFAIEFFLTQKGKLLVNELAPRVHNTGHYTMNGAVTSQFENHIRAILGLPLGSTQTAPAFAMENLLGHPELEISHGALPIAHLKENQFFHWYGKNDLRPGRKLGHLNAIAMNGAKLKTLCKELQATHFAWLDSLTHPRRPPEYSKQELKP